MNKVLIEYITRELMNGHLDEPLSPEDDLLGSGLLDSISIMKLIGFVEKEFEVSVSSEDMTIENFMTVSHIEQYLKSKNG